MQNTLFNTYSIPEGLLDEVHSNFPNAYNSYGLIQDVFHALPISDFNQINASAKTSFLNQGITYAVYGDGREGQEQIFPFDLFPRVIQKDEWKTVSEGLLQRNKALNLFVEDVYAGQKILKDKVIPSDLIFSSPHYCELMRGFRPPGGIYTHICGTDLIRHKDGNFYVLEDNLRCPSGVSYVLSNRETMKQTLSDMFRAVDVEPVNQYPAKLLQMLQSVAPVGRYEPYCVLLTPGKYNSAYYEHTFLAKTMGIDLVEGHDLFVDQDKVYMKTIQGKQRVDVIYRRIDDAFLDPASFRGDSLLGVTHLMKAYKAGNVTLVNAPGTGVSDDKAVCSYVPDMIRYYLGEQPIIDNVQTYICAREKDLQYVLEHLPELVVKPVDMSGGYGVTICDQLSQKELAELKMKIQANPRDYIAQPKMSLSVHSTYIENNHRFEPRHIDLRTFTLLGQELDYVLPGGLTRVALPKGSLIVNSSQGGGSKDTWVIAQ